MEIVGVSQRQQGVTEKPSKIVSKWSLLSIFAKQVMTSNYYQKVRISMDMNWRVHGKGGRRSNQNHLKYSLKKPTNAIFFR